MTWDLSKIEQLLTIRTEWVITHEGSCICVTNEDGLDSYIAISGEQILVESILFAKQQVANTAALNEEILKTHHMFPLTAVAITTIENEEYYMAFGALSSSSDADSIVKEVDILFVNISGFLETYESFLK